MTDIIQQALVHICNFVAKENDAPCSAQSHLDYAIALLSQHSTEWRTSQTIDEEIKNIILDAREHIGLYHSWARDK